MKVLILSAHYFPNVGGVETHLSDLTQALKKRSFEVFVLTYQPLTTSVKWKIYEKSGTVKIFRIPWIANLFYRFVHLPILEFLYLLPGLFIFLPFTILLQDPDVIHTHGIIAGFVGVFWGKIFGKRVITTTHSIYSFPKNGAYRSVSKWIFKNSDAVLTLSEQSKKEVESMGIDPKKVRTFTYWIDLLKFKKVEDAREKLGWHAKFVVLFVGRLVEEKGVMILLNSFKNWNKNVSLAVIGTGSLEENVKKVKTSNFIYLGRIENSKLPIYYSASDLLIIPSVHEEGFGRVILESLACGTPVIGSNRGAIPEAMDNTVGKLIEITPEKIKNTVENFYKNPDKLGKLSWNARKFAEERYSEKNVETIISSYETKS